MRLVLISALMMAAATASFAQPAPVALGLTKAFSPGVIGFAGTSTVTFTVTNPNPVAATNVAFSDLFPELVVANPPNLQTNCAGSTVIGANPHSGSVSFNIPSLAASATCFFSLNINVSPNLTSSATVTFTNVTSTITADALPVGAAATGILIAVQPPKVTKVFDQSQLQLLGPGNTANLIFTITNPNTVTLDDIAFTDTIPSGLTLTSIDFPDFPACQPGNFAFNFTAGSIKVTGLTLPPSVPCVFTALVTAAALGEQDNTTSPITALGGTLSGPPATASVSVVDLFFNWFFAESGGGHP